MNTRTSITIDFPADIYLALNTDETELKQNIKISLAVQLYQSQKLTIGKAAQLAGLSRLEFENLLAINKIPISNLTLDDVNKDISKLK
jgi:predicted HTH domain antitoxin